MFRLVGSSLCFQSFDLRPNQVLLKLLLLYVFKNLGQSKNEMPLHCHFLGTKPTIPLAPAANNLSPSGKEILSGTGKKLLAQYIGRTLFRSGVQSDGNGEGNPLKWFHGFVSIQN